MWSIWKIVNRQTAWNFLQLKTHRFDLLVRIIKHVVWFVFFVPSVHSNHLSAKVAFQAGEKLVYDVYWSFIKAAQLEFEVVGANQNPQIQPGTLLLRGKCRSLGIIDRIYPIRSTVETLAFSDNLTPIVFREDRKEGNRRYQRTMIFDFSRKHGIWSDHLTGHVKRVKLPFKAYDQLGAVYALRQKGLQPETSRTIKIIADGKYEVVNYSVSDQIEKSFGSWGKIPVLLIHSDDIMERTVRRKASLRVYVTADSRHIPLRAEIRFSWGTVLLELREMHSVLENSLNEHLLS